jgi:coiled-coil domain-containing protein 12
MEDRKARLQAIKSAASAKKGDLQAANDAEANDDAHAAQNPTLKFRNYAVKDGSRIKHEKVEASRANVEDVPVVDVERAIGQDVGEVIANVAPKKSNFDLRKEIAGKLAKLERRTQRAIAELAVEEEKKRLAEVEQ